MAAAVLSALDKVQDVLSSSDGEDEKAPGESKKDN